MYTTTYLRFEAMSKKRMYHPKRSAPLDYKFAKYTSKTYSTYAVQITLYSMLMEELYQQPVTDGYIVYVRGSTTIKNVPITPQLRQKSVRAVESVLQIIETEHFPHTTPNHKKCGDCTYRNICVQ